MSTNGPCPENLRSNRPPSPAAPPPPRYRIPAKVPTAQQNVDAQRQAIENGMVDGLITAELLGLIR